MFKIKNFKVEFKHLLTAVSIVGIVASFVVALCSGKKKAAACAAFIASFAGLIAGLGMETGLVPEPAACKKLEIDLENEEEDPFFDADLTDDEARPVKEAEEAEEE